MPLVAPIQLAARIKAVTQNEPVQRPFSRLRCMGTSKEGIDERARFHRLGYSGCSCHIVDIAIFDPQQSSMRDAVVAGVVFSPDHRYKVVVFSQGGGGGFAPY